MEEIYWGNCLWGKMGREPEEDRRAVRPQHSSDPCEEGVGGRESGREGSRGSGMGGGRGVREGRKVETRQQYILKVSARLSELTGIPVTSTRINPTASPQWLSARQTRWSRPAPDTLPSLGCQDTTLSWMSSQLSGCPPLVPLLLLLFPPNPCAEICRPLVLLVSLLLSTCTHFLGHVISLLALNAI